jgi:hypothetical protein
MRNFLLGAIAAVASFAGCQDSGCETALEQDTAAIQEVCGPLDGGGAASPYLFSAFCNTCVRAGYFSMTSAGGGVCSCARLAYNAGSCSYNLSNDDRVAAARDAINYADTTCNGFGLPAEGATPAVSEGGAEGESGEAGVGVDE